jgi:hypothetical protein
MIDKTVIRVGLRAERHLPTRNTPLHGDRADRERCGLIRRKGSTEAKVCAAWVPGRGDTRCTDNTDQVDFRGCDSEAQQKGGKHQIVRINRYVDIRRRVSGCASPVRDGGGREVHDR